MTTCDLDLLREYAQKNSEDAFAALVNRHLNLVYSAALRQVRSPQLAEEVSQSVFADLARNAQRLAHDTVLGAWLYQVTHRTAIDVVRREARRQLREQIATEMNVMNATTDDWTHIEPLLDDAMHALDETDRTAVLLRYFENKSLREIGATLGTSDDAAQKRVSRAVERLREFFAKRGVTVGAGGLAVVISANAVQAAPVGLAVAISTTTLAATAIVTTATITKTIVMTTLQKALITAAIATALGAGIYEAHQNSTLRNQFQTFQQQQTAQIQQLQQERDAATNRLASLLAENGQLKSNRTSAELLKLRGEVTRLRKNDAESSTTQADSRESLMKSWLAREDKLKEAVKQNPARSIPELQLLSEQQWLDAAMNAKFDTDKNVRRTLADLRHNAENNFVSTAQPALKNYIEANNGQFPTDLSQLQPYFNPSVDDAILNRWKIVPQSDVPGVGVGPDWVITEKAPVDAELDNQWALGRNGYGSTSYQSSDVSAAIATITPAMKAYAAANDGKEPADLSQMIPYLTTPEQQTAFQTLMKIKNSTNAPSQ